MKFTIALLCMQDHKGIWRRLPEQVEPDLPGRLVQRNPSLSPSKDMLKSMQNLSCFSDRDTELASMQVLAAIEPFISLATGEQAQLYLLSATRPEGLSMDDWQTIPAMLRSLPAGRNRVAYNKVFQLLAGADQQSLHALELDERLKSRLLDSDAPDS